MHQHARAPHLVVVISDIEMGAGGAIDDFPQSPWLLDWLEQLPEADRLDLVFNGDTFDFLKTTVDGLFPRHIDPVIALAKWQRIEAAHSVFLEGLGRWLLAEPDRHAHFVVGNHDLELQFPEVWEALAARIGAPKRTHYRGLSMEIGELHIEHGQQTDTLFQVDPLIPLLDFEDRRLLNLPWGAVALLDVALPYRDLVFHLDRLKPRHRVFELVPEARKLAIDAYWRYWTRDWWVDLLHGDPLKKVSWGLFREVLYRLGSGDAEIAPSQVWYARMDAAAHTRVWCVGHYHRPGWWERADRKVVFTGAFRNEFAVEQDGATGRPIANTYAVFWMHDNRVAHASLVEVEPPPIPDDYAPIDVQGIREAVRERLAITAT